MIRHFHRNEVHRTIVINQHVLDTSHLNANTSTSAPCPSAAHNRDKTKERKHKHKLQVSVNPLNILSLILYQREAFRERRHLHVSDHWPWVVTLTLSQGQKGWIDGKLFSFSNNQQTPWRHVHENSQVLSYCLVWMFNKRKC